MSEQLLPDVSCGQSSVRQESDGSVTRSVDRALSLLEALASKRSPSRLSDLARATAFSKTTVHRTLATLVARGFVARVGDRYVLGAQLLRLSPATTRLAALQRQLMPFLLTLYERTHCAVSMGVLSDRHVLYSDTFHDCLHDPRPPGPIPAHCTALGKLLLAYNNVTAAELAERELRRFTAKTITNSGELACTLASIRRKSVAYSYGEYITGELEIAVPVFGPGSRVVTGLSVSGSADEFDARAITVAAFEAAHGMSWHLSRLARIRTDEAIVHPPSPRTGRETLHVGEAT